MAKNSGLGKGLDALFSESKVLSEMKKEVAQSDDDKIKNIKIVDIEPNPTQARKKFDEEALNELAASIKNYGLIQPIVVENKGRVAQRSHIIKLKDGTYLLSILLYYASANYRYYRIFKRRT